MQGIHQRPQVGIDLGLQVAGQEAEALARLDRRPNQDDLADRSAASGRPRPWPRPGRSCRCRPGRNTRQCRSGGWPRRSGLAGASWAGSAGRREIHRPARSALAAAGRPGRPPSTRVTRPPTSPLAGRRTPAAAPVPRWPKPRPPPAPRCESAVPRRNADAQRVADSSHVLVAGAEQRQQRLGTDDRYG